MNNKKTIILDIDFQKYVVYFIKHTNELIAINKSENQRILHLLKHYNNYENIPDNEFVKGYSLDFCKSSDTYKIFDNFEKSYLINQLTSDGVWIPI